MRIRTIALALAAVLTGLGLVFSSAIANAAPAKAAHPRAAAPFFPVGTQLYWTWDEGYGAVVATSGVNVSKTASFTIKAPPYNGETFSPEKHDGNPSDNTSAFSGYLQQIGEWVYGPGAAYVPPGYPRMHPPTLTGLHLVWSGRTAYTNNVETWVYMGNGLDKGDAELFKLLFQGGSFF